MPFIDLIRAVASTAIVWHHLAFYGPLSDVAYTLTPILIDLLIEYGRMAVQVFFVLGGFFGARIITRAGTPTFRALGLAILHRYKRLGLPYVAVLAIAVAANALADHWMDHSSISAPPTLASLLAHVVFLQNILGFESITAGIWYVGIDFQIFLLLLVVGMSCAWLSQRLGGWVSGLLLSQLVLFSIALASLLWFNRDSRLDVLGLYFFASYFLGMALAWALEGKLPLPVFLLYTAAMATAGFADARPRLLVAAGTALVVLAAAKTGLLSHWPRSRPVSYLGRISYSLFLIHFPVCLVANAALSRWQLTALESLLAMAGAAGASLIAATLFYHFIEARCLARPRSSPALGTLPAASEGT